MNNQEILNYCFKDKNGKIHENICKNKIINMPQNMIDYLNEIFKDSESINESIYRIKNNILIRPTYKLCNKPVKYLGKGKYRDFCSNHCKGKYFQNEFYKNTGLKSSLLLKSSKEKTKQTLLKKYGVDNISKNENIKIKKKETFFTHFGYENNFCNKNILNKAINNSLSINSVEKRKQTNLNKYGYQYYLNTNKDKHLTKTHKNNISKVVSSDEFQQKRNNTLKKNNTWNTSKYEEIVYNELLKYTNEIDIIKQYKSILYPFNCDFYIISKNLYIEVQCSHFHHFHPYNPNDINDINELIKLKSKNKPQYKNIINTWTIRDPLKRKIAKENQLNYIEIWPQDNIQNIIEKIF